MEVTTCSSNSPSLAKLSVRCGGCIVVVCKDRLFHAHVQLAWP